MPASNDVNLSILTPGKMPLKVFNDIARLVVTPVVEVIVIAQKSVALKQRPSTDSYWPDQYCLPGRVVYSGGPNTLEGYVNIIAADIGIDKGGSAQFCGIELYSTKRGDELVAIYLVFMDNVSELRNGFEFVKFTDINKLNIIAEHKDILQTCLVGQYTQENLIL